MFLAEVGTSVSPGTSLVLAIVSGITAVVVSFIGFLATRHRTDDRNRPAPAIPPPTGGDEPEWVKDLRRDLVHERALSDTHDAEIDRLQRMLYLAGIDPVNGRLLGAHPNLPPNEEHNPPDYTAPDYTDERGQ